MCAVYNEPMSVNEDTNENRKQEKKIKGRTFDIMSDEEIETASSRIMNMIDEADEQTNDDKSNS